MRMAMRIIQFENAAGQRSLGVVSGDCVLSITVQNPSLSSVNAAFFAARRSGKRLEDFLEEPLRLALDVDALNYSNLLAHGKVLAPVSEESEIHPRSRLLISGTGLTHTGSVQQRDEMHQKEISSAPKSDSRKMFEMGLSGGRPVTGQRGAAPEWFYKGDARILR